MQTMLQIFLEFLVWANLHKFLKHIWSLFQFYFKKNIIIIIIRDGGNRGEIFKLVGIIGKEYTSENIYRKEEIVSQIWEIHFIYQELERKEYK